MPQPVKIKVTSDGYGERRNKGHCPIANALKLSDEDILSPKVDDEFVVFSRRSTDLRYEYFTPVRAFKWLRSYDAGNRPKPFFLVLDDSLLDSTKPRSRVSAIKAVKTYSNKGTSTGNSSKPKAKRKSTLTRGL